MPKNVGNNLSNAEQEELIKLLEEKKEKPSFLKFEPHNAQYLFITSQASENFFIAGNQCLAEGTLVLTPSGLKNIEDFKSGDWVYGRSGYPIQVKQVFNNGPKPCVNLVRHNQVLVTCTPDHRFITTKTTRCRKANLRAAKDFYKGITIQQQHIQAPLGTVHEPHAYAIGVLIGDGCCKQAGQQLYISSENSIIPDRVASVLGGKVHKASGNNYTYKMRADCHYYPEWLKGRYAHEKTVDKTVVRTWDRQSCLAFIAGLLDTDGTVYIDRWNNAHLQIGMQAKPVMEMVQELFLTLWQLNKKLDIDDRAKYKNGPLHIVHLRTNCESLLALKELSPYIKTERKQYKDWYTGLQSSQTNPGWAGVKVKPAGVRNTYDIHVDSDDNLYLLANGMVTHNSGKSQAGVVLACILATGRYPEWFPKESRLPTPNRGRICGPDLRNWVPEILEPKIEEMLPNSYVQKKLYNPATKGLDRIIFKNGSVIDIMSYNQKDVSFESWTGNWAWFDEPPGHDIYVGTIRGLAALNGRVYLTATPLTQPWLFQATENCGDIKTFGNTSYREGTKTIIVDDKRLHDITTRTIFCTTDDNMKHKNWRGKLTGGMSSEGLASFLAAMSPEEELIRRYGKFAHLEGLILKEFDPDIHVVDHEVIPEVGTVYQILDPHDAKPHAVAWYRACADGRVYCIRDEEIDGAIDELVNKIKDIEKAESISTEVRILDPNKGRSPTSVSRQTWQEELSNRGLWFETKVNDDIELGHQKIRSYLTHPAKLFFSRERAANTVSSIKNYIYKLQRNKDAHGRLKAIPQTKYKDFPDCLRYLIMYGPLYYKPMQYKGTSFKASNFSTSTRKV